MGVGFVFRFGKQCDLKPRRESTASFPMSSQKALGLMAVGAKWVQMRNKANIVGLRRGKGDNKR